MILRSRRVSFRVFPVLCGVVFSLGLFSASAAFAQDQATTQSTTPSASQSDDAASHKVFNAKTATLDNGLRVVVVENPRAPVVTHMVWYRVGAADEQPGKSGIAHFLEHLMFKGQSNPDHPALGSLGPGQFSKIVKSLGGQDNAFTTQDYTAFYQSVASENLETVMTMEAGRMRGLAPPLKEVKSENKVIQEERRQRTDNDPRAQMAEQMDAALFPNHPYGTPVIGWMHEMQGLTWDDAKAFYDQYYAPNNAIVVVAGDVKAEKVFQMAKDTYGQLAKRDIPVRKRTISPPFIASNNIYLSDKTIHEPVFIREYRVPSYREHSEHSLALQVLEQIVGGGASSRLYRKLVVEDKIATNVNFYYNPDAWNDATIHVSATPAPGRSMMDVQNAIDNIFRDLIKNGISDEELSDAVTSMQADAVYALDSLSGPAMILGRSLITGTPLDDVEHWPQKIEGVTKAQVMEVAVRYLNPDAPYKNPPVNGYLLPKAAKEAQ